MLGRDQPCTGCARGDTRGGWPCPRELPWGRTVARVWDASQLVLGWLPPAPQVPRDTDRDTAPRVPPCGAAPGPPPSVGQPRGRGAGGISWGWAGLGGPTALRDLDAPGWDGTGGECPRRCVLAGEGVGVCKAEISIPRCSSISWNCFLVTIYRERLWVSWAEKSSSSASRDVSPAVRR